MRKTSKHQTESKGRDRDDTYSTENYKVITPKSNDENGKIAKRFCSVKWGA